jgi:Ca2+-binding EF-hand superfamily protein
MIVALEGTVLMGMRMCRSGYLDKSELRKALKLLKHEILDQELDKVFEKIDLNHDGKIDYFEFETGIKTLTAQADSA